MIGSAILLTFGLAVSIGHAGFLQCTAGTYLHRHNQVARIIHQQLALKYKLVDSEVPYYKYVPDPVLESDHVTLYWDRSINTDKTIVVNKPDIVMIDRLARRTMIIDVTIPHDENLVKAEKEKQIKYLDLAHEVVDMWNVDSAVIVPIKSRRKSAQRTAFPTDHVISKPVPGPRYQYMSGPDGPELVDMWMKTSDLLAAARFNPDTQNHYHLFTRSNRANSQPIPFGNNAILRASNFNANRKTVFLVHGWRNTPTSDFNVHLVAAYLNAQDVNVIMVDWSIGAGGDYWTALPNTVRSGESVARYINWLNSASGANLNNYHIIGHSLGGHQVGVIGRNLGGRVPYITALDPAMPGWLTHSQAFRRTDGIYTEVMHTDAGFYGITSPAGDVDFYPNGGSQMPGCGSRDCNHHQCIFYMAESLTRGGFTGRRCNNLNEAQNGNCNASGTLRMGGVNAKTGNSGLFWLRTNARSPFSQG